MNLSPEITERETLYFVPVGKFVFQHKHKAFQHIPEKHGETYWYTMLGTMQLNKCRPGRGSYSTWGVRCQGVCNNLMDCGTTENFHLFSVDKRAVIFSAAAGHLSALRAISSWYIYFLVIPFDVLAID